VYEGEVFLSINFLAPFSLIGGEFTVQPVFSFTLVRIVLVVPVQRSLRKISESFSDDHPGVRYGWRRLQGQDLVEEDGIL